MIMAMLPTNEYITKSNISNKNNDQREIKESKKLYSFLYTFFDSLSLSDNKAL